MTSSSTNPCHIELTRAASRDLDRFGPDRSKVQRLLLRLETNPLLGHPLHGQLQGYRSLEFSTSAGRCRAIYQHHPAANACVVFVVRPHSDAYETAERRAPPPGPQASPP